MDSILEFLKTLILPALVAFATWVIQSRIESFRREREKLHDQKRAVYISMLEPYIRIMASKHNAEEGQKADELIKSFEYRKTSIELNVVADDNVVLAINALLQHFYLPDEVRSKDPIAFMTLWADVILEIRKSVGSPRTELGHYDMMAGWITDIDKYMTPPARTKVWYRRWARHVGLMIQGSG